MFELQCCGDSYSITDILVLVLVHLLNHLPVNNVRLVQVTLYNILTVNLVIPEDHDLELSLTLSGHETKMWSLYQKQYLIIGKMTR